MQPLTHIYSLDIIKRWLDQAANEPKTVWCKYCAMMQQVRQQVQEESCVEVCTACGNVIDHAATPF